MKKLILLAAVILAGAMSLQAKSPKRGLSEDTFQYKAQLAAVAPGVSWYYNWGPSVGRSLAGETEMEFVPMCWNGNYDAGAIRAYVGAHPEVKYLLGFNEPNFTKQANMTPAEAAAKWTEVQALADELGLQLVAPALNYSPNPPYQSPTQWMDEFVAIVGKDAFDYTAIHSYGGFGVMKDLATTFHERYGKPVWVTEFCLWPNEGDPNSYVAPDSQIAAMMQSVEWLEKTEWIYRYAWFKAIGNSSSDKGPNYGLLLSGKGENERELSEQGEVYLNLPDFDTEVYHPVNETVSSASYIGQSGCLLGKSNNVANPLPIEITRFNAGAWLDYQFDVPEAGKYNLVLSVSGQGEPTRFNPTVAIYSVSADGTASGQLCAPRQFSLSGQDDMYADEIFAVTLPAGKQTLLVVDANAYQPSGIRIATVGLYDMAGVGDVALGDADQAVNVYSLQGVLLRSGVEPSAATTGLPAGIYIVGDKKITVR